MLGLSLIGIIWVLATSPVQRRCSWIIYPGALMCLVGFTGCIVQSQ